MAADKFSKFKSSLNRGVTAISLKTSSSLEKAKIKTHMDSIQGTIDRMIVTAGETAYSLWAQGATDYAPLHQQLAAIHQKREEIKVLQAEYAAIDERDKQILGTEAAAMQQEQQAPFVCPGCGARYAGPVKFCGQCGYNFGE